MRYQSWGRNFSYTHRVRRLQYRSDNLDFLATDGPHLPFGLGRSYADVCLNDGGWLIDTTGMNHLMRFDEERGLLRAEAGASLLDILRVIVPKGWFLPVTPGTKYVTLGGAIANDVHGKNHHCDGAFGRYVTCFELARSDGTRYLCSPEENVDLYRATIGGMGLTGLITWAELQLIPVTSAMIDVETIRFTGLERFQEISEQSDKDYVYTVAWVDVLSDPVRGHFMRGNHASGAKERLAAETNRSLDPKLLVPFDCPGFLLNGLTVKAFNSLYFHRLLGDYTYQKTHYNSFFYPLDMVGQWNRIYGKRGVYQYQFVLPFDRLDALRRILSMMAQAGMASFLVVLKLFGELDSPGMMSFPQPGWVLALDFPNKGEASVTLMRRLNEIVFANGGRLYSAKDSIMTPEEFAQCYPQWKKFSEYIDPHFSSSFWRRVTGQ